MLCDDASHECVYYDLLRDLVPNFEVHLLRKRMCTRDREVIDLTKEPDRPVSIQRSPADRRPQTPLVEYPLSPVVADDDETDLECPPTPFYNRRNYGGASPQDFYDMRPYMENLVQEEPPLESYASPVSPLMDLDTSTPRTPELDLYPTEPPALEVHHVIHVDSDGETEVHIEARSPPANQLADTCSWCVDSSNASSPDEMPVRRRRRRQREVFSSTNFSPQRLDF